MEPTIVAGRRSKAARAVGSDAGVVNAAAPIKVGAIHGDQVQPVLRDRFRALAHLGGEAGLGDLVAALARVGGVLEET
jgi:hypothetical protein